MVCTSLCSMRGWLPEAAFQESAFSLREVGVGKAQYNLIIGRGAVFCKRYNQSVYWKLVICFKNNEACAFFLGVSVLSFHCDRQCPVDVIGQATNIEEPGRCIKSRMNIAMNLSFEKLFFLVLPQKLRRAQI